MAREQKCKKEYRNAAGEKTTISEAVHAAFVFSDGQVLSIDPSELSAEIQKAAMFHGLHQKIGDSYAGKKTVEECVEAAGSTLEQLTAGNWLGERESAGPRISVVLEASLAFLAEQGVEITDDVTKAIAEGLKAKGAAQAALSQNPGLAAHKARIEAERAAARASAAAEKAKGVEFDPNNFMNSFQPASQEAPTEG